MGEIKSAWEIAMEKIEELEELTPEEIKKQKEKKYTPISQALADKYLDGIDLRQLNVELDKHKAEDRDFLSQLVVLKLVSSIELGNHEKLSKVMEGISHLKQMGEIGEIGHEIEQLFQEYEIVEQKERKQRGRSTEEVLQQLGISGSAISEIISRTVVEGQQDLDRLAEPYKERLEQLKQKLIEFPLK